MNQSLASNHSVSQTLSIFVDKMNLITARMQMIHLFFNQMKFITHPPSQSRSFNASHT